MTHVATLLLSLCGFALLLCAMARHQQDWLRRKLSPRTNRTLRLSGFAALTLAFVIAGLGLGWSYGAVVWFGSASAGAALTVAVNINREKIMRGTRRENSR